MSQHPYASSWWAKVMQRCRAAPEDLQGQADRCEALGAHQQREGFEGALRVLANEPLAPDPASADDDAMWIGLLADSGAFESAAQALLPPQASFTLSRLADGTVGAQVILPSGAGAHSRAARSLSMALVAALLRALARELVEQRAVQ